MTEYAVDPEDRTIIAVWDSGLGKTAKKVTRVSEAVSDDDALCVADDLSTLSRVLWRCYTHPASAAESMEPNSEGWRRSMSRKEFETVISSIRKPNLPAENGLLIVSYDPVQEAPHRLGRTLHAIGDATLTEHVISEAEAELAAVVSAEQGDLRGRAVQAVGLNREDASPVQVAHANSILARDPLDAAELFTDVEPTAAAVAAAHWLAAAAEVAGEAAGVEMEMAPAEADNITALPVSTLLGVLGPMAEGASAREIVTLLIRDALQVAEGKVPSYDRIVAQFLDIEDKVKQYAQDDPETAKALRTIDITPIDPLRPSLDLLEDILQGISGCFQLFEECTFEPDDSDDSDDFEDENRDESYYDELREDAEERFREAVREIAELNADRLL
ncbi:hypothetical protein AB0B28_18785 [Glycomyces sp. NPDC046736]|uniref:hypothetical protein n=1 Tax=Glycomyces sp. NPDC046736 TaxID=3155615 RepID=UPI0033FC4574